MRHELRNMCDYFDDTESFVSDSSVDELDIHMFQANSNNDNITNEKCKHKKINCTLFYECCDKEFGCVMCHNEWYCKQNDMSHKINTQVNKIRCNSCNVIQQCSNICICFHIKFANYFCEKCNCFSEKTCKHCIKCGFCSIITKLFVEHCDVCECCIESNDVNIKVNHSCIKNRLSDKCSICYDDLDALNDSIQILRCRHMLHTNCLERLLVASNKCPLCSSRIN